ncbi:Na+/H+ antiporter NhaC family protein [Arthrobacter sp. H14]|uniref:Na+/H+ antiporter NhaC family protein n=1 Tax=Arthrobacter sp. H14 TaxID=1312959 RepID=UPI00047D9555|nr:Na+/H+ antiporter NhaC family protein [Arthrobacter sp. H14]
MEPSILSLLPPVIAIGLAIVTKRILPSLAIGIILGALLYSQWNILATLALIFDVASGLVIADGSVAEEMYILAFVILLGILTSFIYLSGGLRAFSEWAITKVRTRVQAQLVPIVLGIIIFFDDAFSSLVGGNVSRTITDKHRISRAKLSYLVDSTAAPVIILMPISGWAAFIAATMAGILAANGITQYSGYEAFLLSIPTNYYAITAILFVIAVAYFSINIGPMRKHEKAAIEDGVLFDTSQGPVPGEADRNLPTRDDGKVGDLILPVATLIGVTVVWALWIGISNTEGAITPMNVLANTDVIISLFYGGLAACALSAVRLLMKRVPGKQVGKATWSGVRSMLMAGAVLFLAWMTAGIISLLGIGEYVARLLDGDLAIALLPVILFALAAFISFSMGSTFGTFGLILPIAAQIAITVDISLLIPVFGAVLAGAIFGDHTSPLSDTTILSSIGSGIHLIDHVKTQMPYAMVCAGASMVGYISLGLSRNIVVGLVTTLAALAIAVFVLRTKSAGVRTPATDSARSSE